MEFNAGYDSKLLLSTGKYSGDVSNFRQFDGIISGTTTYSKSNFNAEFHYHSNPHLSFILQGGNIETRKQVTTERKVGDIMFFHSGELHRTLPANSLSKNMNLELESNFLKQNNISEISIASLIVKNPNSKFLILKMYKELLEKDIYSNTSIQMLLLDTITKPINSNSNKRPQWLIELLEILNDEWSKFHNLTDLSLAINVHPTTISKYFTRYCGCTLGEYMRKLKIDKSLTLIKNESLSLTEIAVECGFSDQSHFIRNFKKYTHHLPKEFQYI